MHDNSNSATDEQQNKCNSVKVSIIIPVYNVEKYLRTTLDCLLNQTLKDIEVICVNDCSKDGSLEILNEYSAKDDRVKVIDLKENVGAAVARNKGLEVAKGEYLGFVDSDDEIDLNFYEELYKKAVETGADIVKGNSKLTQLDGTTEGNDLNKIIANSNKYRFVWMWVSAIYRASVIFDNGITFPNECSKGQDSVFLNRVVLKANNIEIVNDVFYHYIRREDSLDREKLPVKSVKSTLLGKVFIAEDLNSSDLFEKSREDYNYCYLYNLKKIFIFLFRSDEVEAKTCLAKTLIDVFHMSKDTDYLEEKYPYPIILKLVKEKKYSELSEFLVKCRNINELKYGKTTFLQKIFSIKDYGKRLLLTILGMKIKIKR